MKTGSKGTEEIQIANIALEPYSDTPVNIVNVTARVNNLNVLCFVLARHIAMIFATFNALNGRADKKNIINSFIEKKLMVLAIEKRMNASNPQVENINNNFKVHKPSTYR